MTHKPNNAWTEPVQLQAPQDMKKLLLHSCCAPCSGEVMETLIHNKIDYSILFYNPNIHPEKEYLLRKEENIRFAQKHKIEFIDADYDTQNWFSRTEGYEQAPERGQRCTICFDMRFEYTAHYALHNGFDYITSSLGISRWKDMDQINDCGLRSAQAYAPVRYWVYNWRKRGGANRMIHISKRESFYQQEYCGCVYSLRDTNRARKARGHQRIQIGERYYLASEPARKS